MEIAPEKVKTEPPEDEVASEEPEIEVGEVKYESGQAPTPQDPLACDEVTVKEEPMLTVEHGMLPANDAVVLSDAIISIPPVTIKEEPQDLEEGDPCADPVDFAFVEETKIKSEPADTENKEAEPGPSTSSVFGQFICYYCCAVHHKKGILSQHMRTIHGLSSRHAFIPTYMYELADENVSDSSKPTPKRFACSLCDFRSFHAYIVRNHFCVNHSEEKPYSCKLCDYKCKTKASLCSHNRSHLVTPHSKKKFGCSHCDYASSRSCQLKMHVRTNHTHEKPYICTACGVEYSVMGSLRKHEKVKHGGTYYSCTKCDFKCSSHQQLVIHRNSMHHSLYECYSCHYKTASRNRFISHVSSHMRMRPYPCDFCAKTFGSLALKKTHMQRDHTGCKKLYFFSMDNL